MPPPDAKSAKVVCMASTLLAAKNGWQIPISIKCLFSGICVTETAVINQNTMLITQHPHR